jgi:hypothetical protein
MLDLRRDLYARLVISTQKNKLLNKPFRPIHSDSWTKYPASETEERTIFEKKVFDEPVVLKSDSAKTIKRPSVDKIDEKVEKIISDPHIEEIKMELAVAEGLLKKIKSVDPHNVKIPLLEQNIAQFRMMLEQKIYVY